MRSENAHPVVSCRPCAIRNRNGQRSTGQRHSTPPWSSRSRIAGRPDLRAIIGPDRACTVVFDPGG